MQKINIRRIIYHIKTNYLTLNNAVILVAFAIAAGWIWGSLGVMQRNYTLQKEVDSKNRELQLAELETRSMELESRFLKTNEYKELAVRQRMGLGKEGERVMILPANSPQAVAVDAATGASVGARAQETNFEQWMNFLFGGNSKKVTEQT